MLRKGIWALAIVLCFAVAAAAQMPEGYLDVYVVKVKPEKRDAFDALAQKFAEANRKGGDYWRALDVSYGEQNTVSFISTRASYADIEKASGAFMGALTKAYGEAGVKKLFADFNNCITSARGEVRLRRWDLSTNIPADPEAVQKILGETRWFRTVMVRVRPGRALEYEAWVKRIKAAVEKTPGQRPVLVSQAVAGQQGTVYYFSWPAKSLGDLDGLKPLSQIMGESEFEKFQKAVAEVVLTSETTIVSLAPRLSNPSDDIVAAAPDFWRPKAAAKPKAAAGAEAKPKAPA